MLRGQVSPTVLEHVDRSFAKLPRAKITEA